MGSQENLQIWLTKRKFNSWTNYILPAPADIETTPAPERVGYLGPQFRNAWNDIWECRSHAPYVKSIPSAPRVERLFKTDRGSFCVPERLDVLDFGNTMVYCAIGAYAAEKDPDLSRIIKLCGPQKRDIPLSPPHYDLPGGPVYKALPATRCLVFSLKYRLGNNRIERLFRHCDQQIQRYVSRTGIGVTTISDGAVKIDMIDFAPLNPELSFVCRLFSIQNLTSDVVDDLSLVCTSTSSQAWPSVSPVADGLILEDAEAGHGVQIHAPGWSQLGPPPDFNNEPEMGWQNISIQSQPIALAPNSSSTTWLSIIPLLTAGDAEQERALKAQADFDPLNALESTRISWENWSAKVQFESDNQLLTDLIDTLQVLLKTHEGVNGFHLGTTYQRHTHGWIRDNCLIQRGLLSTGRVKEAGKNLLGFLESWQKSGVAVGYHIFERRDWSPRPTAELYAYLILMVRDYQYWAGRDELVERCWPMVQSCADLLYTNSRGLAGFDGDEIWYWELDQQELWKNYGEDRSNLDEASVLDNCWLALAALDFAAAEAGDRGLTEQRDLWQTKRDRISASMEEHLWSPELRSYHSLLMPNGAPYTSPFVNGLCTPQFWGVPEKRPGSYAAGARLCNEKLSISEGLVRGNTETSTYAGLTPPFYLYALASLNSPKAENTLSALIRHLPSSGGIWEYTVVECPVSFTDKRRGGDSGVLLASVLHYLFGFTATREGFSINPHPYSKGSRFELLGINYRGIQMNLKLGPSKLIIEKDDQPWMEIPAGTSLTYNIAQDEVRKFPQRDSFSLS